MVGRIRPEPGARPWLPAHDVDELYQLDFYDIPLAGIIRQDGVTYLYTCILSQEAPENLWAYAPVSDEEVLALHTSYGDDLLAAIERALWNKPVVIAGADQWRLALWDAFDAGQEGPIGLAHRFVRRFGRELGESDFLRELANRRELVDA